MFNSFHVPLVDNNNNSVTFNFVNLSEKIIIALVNKDFFHLREEYVHVLDVPVQCVGIQAFFCESLCTYVTNFSSVF
jgi:hypothetical protein